MRHTVLFVDDDPQILSAMQRVFRHEPYDKLTAQNARAAMGIMEGMVIDLIVSDYQMPDTTGLELLSWARMNYPTTERIMITGQASVDLALGAINEGEIYRFFTKPYNDIELGIAIRHALQRRDLILQTNRLLETIEMQKNYIDKLEAEHPGITVVSRDHAGAILLDDFEDDLSHILHQVSLRED